MAREGDIEDPIVKAKATDVAWRRKIHDSHLDRRGQPTKVAVMVLQ